MDSTPHVPAIVLGADITALGVIRILSRQNIKTHFISDQRGFVKHSRWAYPLLLGVDTFLTSQDLAGLLEPLEHERAVLFPCSDNFLKAVVELPIELQSRFRSSLPAPERLDCLINKAKFSRILNEAGIPHPETSIIENSAQLRALDAVDFKRYFLKPVHSKSFRLRFDTKGFRLSSLEEALEKFRMIQAANLSVMLQEYIPGPANQHYFVDGFIDREGEIRALFVRRRERIYPPYFGNSSYCVSIPLEMALGAVESVRRLVDFLDYRGIFSAEFKFDERDKQFKILEVNARPWWYVEFAYQCGVDTVRMAYRDALEMPVVPVQVYQEGVGCMYVLNDLRAAMPLIKSGEMSLITWLRQFLRAKNPIFSWDDPLPAVVNALRAPFRYFRKKVAG
jgi:predicted ATP-grasp superfamily ATP-dependent carboligase